MGRVKILLLILYIIGSFLIPDQSKARVVISKIGISGVSSTDEFVELYNFASNSVDITGWSMTKYTSGGTPGYLVSAFPAGSTLGPFGYFLVAHRDYSGATAPDLFYTNNSNSLASHNSLVLKDGADVEIDVVNWGILESGQNLTRLPNDQTGNYMDTDTSTDFIISSNLPFNTHSPSRPVWISETETAPLPTTNWDAIRINEVVPNPTEGEEWVELFNVSSDTIALSGATLCDSRADGCTIAELKGEISPGSWLVVKISGSKLNNDGDSVILKDPDGSVVDRVEYGGSLLPGKGQSLAREYDGTGNWAVTEALTSGANNIIYLLAPAPTPISVGGGQSGGLSGSFTIPHNSKNTTAKIKSADKDVSVAWQVRAPSVVILNSSTLFDAHNSADPRGGELLFTWDFGDGTVSEGARVLHSFASSGIYSVTLRATSTQDTFGQKIMTVKVDGGFDPVILGEALVKPEYGEDEWVSVQSLSTTSLNLGGWKLSTESRSFTVPTGTILKSGKALKFFKTATHLSLVDSGGSIFLTNVDGRVVDILDYGKAKRNELVTSILPPTTSTTIITKNVLGKKFYRPLTIAEIRELPLRSEAQTVGTVISLPGVPYVNNFYIRDGSGGIQVYSYKKDFPTLSLGDKVIVRGQLGSSMGQQRLVIKKGGVTISAKGSNPKAEHFSLSELSPEQTGTLIAVEGEITSLKSTLLYLDDGDGEIAVTLSKKMDLPKDALVVGARCRITGILEESKNGLRLVPRSAQDIVTLEKAQTERKRPPISSSAIYGSFGAALVILSAAAKKWLIK